MKIIMELIKFYLQEVGIVAEDGVWVSHDNLIRMYDFLSQFIECRLSVFSDSNQHELQRSLLSIAKTKADTEEGDYEMSDVMKRLIVILKLPESISDAQQSMLALLFCHYASHFFSDHWNVSKLFAQMKELYDKQNQADLEVFLQLVDHHPEFLARIIPPRKAAPLSHVPLEMRMQLTAIMKLLDDLCKSVDKTESTRLNAAVAISDDVDVMLDLSNLAHNAGELTGSATTHYHSGLRTTLIDLLTGIRSSSNLAQKSSSNDALFFFSHWYDVTKVKVMKTAIESAEQQNEITKSAIIIVSSACNGDENISPQFRMQLAKVACFEKNIAIETRSREEVNDAIFMKLQSTFFQFQWQTAKVIPADPRPLRQQRHGLLRLLLYKIPALEKILVDNARFLMAVAQHYSNRLGTSYVESLLISIKEKPFNKALTCDLIENKLVSRDLMHNRK